MTSSPPTFTVSQAAAFLDWESKPLRKAILGVVPAKPARLPFEALVYLRAERASGVSLSLEYKKTLYERIASGLRRSPEPDLIALNSVLRFQIGDIIKEMRSRIGRFTSWSKKIVEDPQIMGGAPVFPDSRLTVKRVAELLASGESQGTILEDYPYLNAEDLEFAPLYEKAFPKVGRPPRARQAAD